MRFGKRQTASVLVATFGLSLAVASVLSGIPAKKAEAAACTITVTNTNDNGAGSLRQAIISANGASSTDVICFSVGSGHIQIIPTSQLPALTQKAVIDGTTQPGFSGAPIVELSGNGAGASAVGLWITGNGAGSTIKGMVVNRFGANGIFMDSGNNTIVGNYVGLTADGNSAAGNGSDGIGIFAGSSSVSASNNFIGGTTTDLRNVISGNKGNGLVINAQNGGITDAETVAGNYIGTNAAGNGVIANRGDGVLVNDAGGGAARGSTIGGTTGTTPGGACTGACNLISGNGANGVGLWHTGAAGNTVAGNLIGVTADGFGLLGNGDIGVESQDSPNSIIGGTTPNSRNVISGNLGAGVFIDGGAATNNVIEGNYIGTNTAGTAAIGNKKMGIGIGYTTDVTPAHNVTIGGTTSTTPGGACTGACNLISGNGQNGILIVGPGANQMFGNYIGTDVNGTANIRNGLDGIGMANTANNLIGDGTNNGRNIIAANGDNGIILTGGTGNRIVGNNIGEGSNGGSLGNAGAGVMLPGGIVTAVLGNNIGYNGKLGIDLNYDNVSYNDSQDSDGGANSTQNFPEVYAAHTVSNRTLIGGQLSSSPNTSFQLDFFASTHCNAGVPMNFGEGENYIGSTTVSTDQFGNTAYSFVPTNPVPGRTYITATATRKIGSIPAETSEFSKCRLVNVARPAVTNGATWFLKDDLTSGPADKTFGYGFPSYLLFCAWDPNQQGVKLPVVFSGGTWFMRASYTTGKADLNFSFGAWNAKPVCGDWNGDGVDTIGVVSPDSTWNLRDVNGGGGPDYTFQYGPYNSTPVAGDWNGDGITSVGTVDGANNWSLRDTNGGGPADYSFHYGVGRPVVGDWLGSGRTSIGVVSPGGHWALKTTLGDGPSNVDFDYGPAGYTPVVW